VEQSRRPTGAAKKLSAFFISAPVYRRASDFTVETRREAEMRTARIVAITLAFAIGAQAQTKADRSPSGGFVWAAGKGRVEIQARV
jgi:hypothetical protein